MSFRNISITLASVVVLASGLPAFAQDSSTVQDNVQTTNVSGNRNTTKNDSAQGSFTSQRGRTGDAATSQKSDQLSTVNGNRNDTNNVNRQGSGTFQTRGR